MNPVKHELAVLTNPEGIKGSLKEVLKGADVVHWRVWREPAGSFRPEGHGG